MSKESTLQLRRKHRVHYREDEVEQSTAERKDRAVRSVVSSGYGGRAPDKRLPLPVFLELNTSSRKRRQVSVIRSGRRGDAHLQRLREVSRSPPQHVASRRPVHRISQKEAPKQSFVGRTVIRRPRHKVNRTLQTHPVAEGSPTRRPESAGPAAASPSSWALSSESEPNEFPGAHSLEVNLNSIGLAGNVRA